MQGFEAARTRELAGQISFLQKQTYFSNTPYGSG